MTSTLTRILGSENIDLCEDVVQDALVRALEQWPYTGIPRNPSAWLIQVAKNRALDVIRRERRHADWLEGALEQWSLEAAEELEPPSPAAVDDLLGMTFLCAHPSLPPEGSVALALKTVAGFGVREIARALLVDEPTIYQRLLRAKRQIKDRKIAFELPDSAILPRIDTVLQVLYLWFNEGYAARDGAELIREDMCLEALRLTTSMTAHPILGLPKVHALLSLMLFQAARFPARTDGDGALLLLEQQERRLWNREMRDLAILHLERAAEGHELTRYHLEAGIAACHALAPTYAETDWAQIVELYEQLLAFQTSPVVELNYAVALSRLRGPRAAREILERLHDDRTLRGDHLSQAILGQLWLEAGQPSQAAQLFARALSGPLNEPTRKFLLTRFRAP